MKLTTALVSAALVGLARAAVQGFDISSYQGTVDFAAAYKSGARFVIIKVSTENRSQGVLTYPAVRQTDTCW